jgi:hypothetical protein
VPEGKGLGSSAAVEIAVAQATAGALGHSLEPRRLAPAESFLWPSGTLQPAQRLKIYAFKRYQDHRRFLAMERAYVSRKIRALAR